MATVGAMKERCSIYIAARRMAVFPAVVVVVVVALCTESEAHGTCVQLPCCRLCAEYECLGQVFHCIYLLSVIEIKSVQKRVHYIFMKILNYNICS